ncbi:transcriptional regulator TACO1-like protein [Gorgonomyces haynaldii]|nr:transcriptional regulator TACO1-like protein [Gorgonomyces haynaldii]
MFKRLYTQNHKILAGKSQNDLLRASRINKVTKHIISAIKSTGETDPSMNPLLSHALALGKQYQVPKHNIQEAIKKATSKDKDLAIKHVIYQGMAHGGSVVIESLTPNTNKTHAEIRLIFKQHGGQLSTVQYLFDFLGLIRVEKTDESLEKALDLDLVDIQEQEDQLHLYCEPEQLSKLNLQDFKVLEQSRVYRPKEVLNATEAFHEFVKDLENQEETVRVHTDSH